MSQTIEEYISKARNSGLNDQQIKDNLTKAGWLPEKIDPILAALPAAAPAEAAQPDAAQTHDAAHAGPKQHFSITALPDKIMNAMWSAFRKVEK